MTNHWSVEAVKNITAKKVKNLWKNTKSRLNKCSPIRDINIYLTGPVQPLDFVPADDESYLMIQTMIVGLCPSRELLRFGLYPGISENMAGLKNIWLVR